MFTRDMIDVNFYTLPLIALLLFLLWISIKITLTPKNLAPGPWGLPIVGYIPFLGPKPHVKMADMKKKYGDIIRIKFGKKEMVFLNSYDAIKEALIKQADVFSIRSQITISTPLYRDYLGIVRSSGEMWSEFRRFTLSTLRELGFGKSSLEPKIINEIQYFLNEIEQHNGQPADISRALQASITNVICIVMTGQRYDYNDKIFQKLLHLFDEYLTRIVMNRVSNFFPKCLRKPTLLKFFRIKSAVISAAEIFDILNQILDDLYTLYEPESRNNFIEAWFSEAKKNGVHTNYFTNQHLAGVLFDLFIAGSDTTTNSLIWGLFYMVEYPEIQNKIQREIDDVIGRDRSPTMSDQKLMPYTEATLMEIFRCSTIVPLAVFHGTQRDTILKGYLIRENTLIAPNLWAVHHDSTIFPDSHVFMPERFLNDKKQVQRMEQLIPFSMGKRQCIGESLARMKMFLYFTSILQKFSLKKVAGVKVDFDYNFAVISKLKPQKLCAILR